MVPQRFAEEVLSLIAPRLAGLLAAAVRELTAPLEEIRLRQGRPVHLVTAAGDGFLTPAGRLTGDAARAEVAYGEDLTRSFQLIARGSVYAWEDEVRTGYLTLPGGHRVGLAGRVVTEAGRVRTFRSVAGLNIRIAREVRGAAAGLLPRLVAGGRAQSTLIVSPPQAGKTTVLRDLVRLLSTGVPALGLRGQKVGLVDERSEVAGCREGVPQLDVGPRTDVLDGCPKAEGLLLLIRSMSPDVVALDEIGRREDALAVLEGLHAGVAVIATAHGFGPEDIRRRPALAELLATGAFRRVAVLGRSRGPGTVEKVFDLTDAAGGGWVADQDARSGVGGGRDHLDRVAGGG